MHSDQPLGHSFDPRTLRLAPEPEDLASVLLRCLGATEAAACVVDARAPDMPILWVNAAFEVSTGYWAEQVIGRNTRLLHGLGTDQVTIRRVEAAMRAQRSSLAALVVYRPDGSSWVTETHLSPIRDRTGVLTHWLGSSQDVTDRVGTGAAALDAGSSPAPTGARLAAGATT